MPLSLTQKLYPIDNHLKMKYEFPPREFHWENKVLSREDACPAVDSQQKTHCYFLVPFFVFVLLYSDVLVFVLSIIVLAILY